MEPHSARGRGAAPHLAAIAVMTLVALYPAWAAFHDMLHESDLRTEYTVPGISAACLTFVAVSLVWSRRLVLGSVSLVALAAGVWGQYRVGPEGATVLSPAYLATAGAYLWFLSLAGILMGVAWQANRGGQSDLEP